LKRTTDHPTRAALEIVPIEDSSEWETLAGEWLDLAERLPSGSYFQTPDWVASWWETIAGKPPTRLVTWRRGSGGLEAVVALSRVRWQVRRGLPLSVPIHCNAGSGPGDADQCAWPVFPGREGDVRDWLKDQAGESTLLLRNMDLVSGGSVLPPGGRAVESFLCPRLSLLPADTPIGRSGNFLRQLRKYSRRLREAGVTFRWLSPGRFDGSALEHLFRLHQGRRRALARGTSFDRTHLGFHRKLIERAGERRGPAGLVAVHDGHTIGVLYGFWWKTAFHAYQSGWDPTWSSSSLGTAMLHQAIESARAEGAEIFDFLRGSEPYKYRFGAVDRIDTTWLFSRGMVGRLMTARYGARDLLRVARGHTAPVADT
jgi:CelD/BcsL family acetyltransferase involved in cellulose biosynthesis